MRYRPHLPLILEDLSFEINPGEKVGICGRTGAGKSSICLTVPRIVELDSGSIEIDGVDTSKIDLDKLRSKITVIPQDPTIFTGSLRFNLDPFKKHSNEVIEQVIRDVGLEELLTRIPAEKKNFRGVKINFEGQGRGIYFRLHERGGNLSEGQKQLICIARAILEQNKVVILDEATSSIDVNTEKKIQELMTTKFKDATVITIAHRLNTIIQSDKVLVLDYGRLAEYDSP